MWKSSILGTFKSHLVNWANEANNSSFTERQLLSTFSVSVLHVIVDAVRDNFLGRTLTCGVKGAIWKSLYYSMCVNSPISERKLLSCQWRLRWKDLIQVVMGWRPLKAFNGLDVTHYVGFHAVKFQVSRLTIEGWSNPEGPRGIHLLLNIDGWKAESIKVEIRPVERHQSDLISSSYLLKAF